ncbi:hypothetical protein CPB85DRAFT_252553 [Mucidula mucida]|nr:hypothetical protein CPB85DRAFT_252553 [Mucidula mucida]
MQVRTSEQSTSTKMLTSRSTQPQWETCQSMEEKCLLDASNPENAAAWSNTDCKQGSIPQYCL